MRGKRPQLLAAFLLGLVMGAMLINLRQAGLLDRLYLENNELKSELGATAAEVRELRESAKKGQRRVLSGIEVRVEVVNAARYPAVEVDAWRAAVEKNVRDLLQPLVGQPADEVSYTLVPQVINGRILDVENHRLQIQVDLVALSDRLYVHVQAQIKSGA